MYNSSNEEYIFQIGKKTPIQFIKKFFCDPFNDYIIYEIDKNDNNELNIILKIKDINQTFAYFKNIKIKDYNYYYIKWNIINNNTNKINTNKLENLKNKIKTDLDSKNNSNNYFKKLFLLMLLEYLQNKNYLSLIKFIYSTITEFLNHDSVSDDNINLLLNFLNQDMWFNIVKDYIKYSKNNNFNKNISVEILFTTLNNILINYIIDIENKYIKINNYKIKYNLNIPEDINLQINKDFERRGSIIYINGYNYIINIFNKNISNDFKLFIKKICIENDIKDDNTIKYLYKIIMNLCHQGAQQLASHILSNIFSKSSVLKQNFINMIFKFINIKKNQNNIVITAYLNNIYEICTLNYEEQNKNKIKLGYYKNLQKYFIKINNYLEIIESNIDVNNYLNFNDDIFNYSNDIIENYDKEMNTSKVYYITLCQNLILEIFKDNLNKNIKNRLNLIYNIYRKTYNFNYYELTDKIFNYLLYKNRNKKNILLEKMIDYCYNNDIDNNFFINFFANKVSKPIIKNEILPTIIDYTVSKSIIKNMQKDILIISYNEQFKNFDDYHVFSILYKILVENPKIIVVCTQESPGITTIKNSYQKILEKYLNNYNLLDKLYYSSNFSLKKFNMNDKNVRTYVYQRKDYNGVKYCYLEKSVKSGLSSVMNGTLNKGSILLKLNLEENNQKFDYIIVNSHLFSNKKVLNEIAFAKRKDEFFNLIEEFNLPNNYKRGYNIFFCGDLNFKLLNPRLYKKEFDSTIINNYLKNNANKFTEKYKKTNELIQILNNNSNSKIKKLNSISIYKDSFKDMIKNFKENIIKMGYDLTCKYKINEKINNEKKKKLEKGIIDNNNFKLKNNSSKYIPSMCDRILFASKNNLDIEQNNFNMYLLPNKTDHKLLTLSFNFDYFENFK